MHTCTNKSEYFTLKNGDKVRGDAGDCLLLLRRYYHRAVEDPNGLTFKRWEEKQGDILVVNSSELRAVQGRQANDFVLVPINPPKLREKHGRAKKGAVVREVGYASNQKWCLDIDIDRDTREVCDAT